MNGSNGQLSRQGVLIVGPSTRFLSGITHYTYSLANNLSGISGMSTSVLLNRKLLPLIMFPGRRRVGKKLSNLTLGKHVRVLDGIDYLPGKSWKAAREFLEATSPAVLIITWWTVSTAHVTRFLLEWAKRLGVTTIADVHELGDPIERSTLGLKLLSRLISRNVLRRFDRIVVHSKGAMTQLEAIGVTEALCTYFPLPAESYSLGAGEYHRARTRWGFEEESVVLLPGIIRNYKGHTLLLDAIPGICEVLDAKVHFVIAGELWEDGAHFREVASRLAGGSALTHIDRYLTDSDYRTLLSACDVVVLPYLRTMQSAVAADAMALGKPIVASDLPDLRDQLGYYKGAWFFETGNSRDLARVLIQTIGAIRSGNPSSFKISSDLEWSAIAAQYVGLVKGNDAE